MFGLLGAQVTVADIADGQLDRDRKSADHYGYEINTIQADMRDLSCLDKDKFDLVCQSPSMAYILDVRIVYVEVARVLRSRGRYRIAHTNPAVEFVEMDSWEHILMYVPWIFTIVGRKEKNALQTHVNCTAFIEDF